MRRLKAFHWEAFSMYRPLIDAVITADELTVDELPKGWFSVTIPIGESDDQQTVLTLVCEATPSGHEGDAFYEFSFHFERVPLADPDASPEEVPEVEELWTSEAGRERRCPCGSRVEGHRRQAPDIPNVS
jgi:hypothetical protein